MADLYGNSSQLAKIEERKFVAPGHHLPHKSEQFTGSGLEFENNVIKERKDNEKSSIAIDLFDRIPGSGCCSDHRYQGSVRQSEMDGTGGRLGMSLG